VCIYCITLIAPAKSQQTRSEFTAASRSFPATAWLSCVELVLYAVLDTTATNPVEGVHMKTMFLWLRDTATVSDQLNRLYIYVRPVVKFFQNMNIQRE